MKIDITARSTDITDMARRLAAEKCAKVERFFQGRSTIRAILDKQHEEFRVELIAQTPGKHTVVIEEADTDLLAAIDKATERMERHVRKTKERLTERHRKPRPELAGPQAARSDGEEPSYQQIVDGRRTA